MIILNCKRIRKKWYKNFFMYHGIRKVTRNFASDSLEILLLENLLLDFTKHISINNKYSLMGGLDYELYEEKFYNKALSLMSVLNNTSETAFEITYNNHVMYVTLK